jgi:hypothetical protein
VEEYAPVTGNGAAITAGRQECDVHQGREGVSWRTNMPRSGFRGRHAMKAGVIALAVALSAFATTGAQAQWANIGGQYLCVQNCAGPGPAYVTGNGWDLNLVNEIGQPSRAWIDYPGHIWADFWHEGAVFSPDGGTIQFDSGSVWQRYTPPPPPLVRTRY